jgi:hydroxylaminobenzene mutase
VCYQTPVDRRRRLFWHGIFLFFLGLIVGAFVQQMTNPRMGLSAHLGGVMTGTFLAVLGAAWTELRLWPHAESAAYWLALFGSYGSSASLLLAAIPLTSSMTPIAGAGHSAPAWQERLVNLGLQSTAAAMLLCCLLLLWGLRGRR